MPSSEQDAGPKIVLDTNILVSAALSPNGLPAQVYEAVVRGEATAYASREMIDELRRTLNVLIPHLQEAALTTYLEHLVIIEPPPFTGCRDPDDDKFIACALAAHADFLVTGDADLLVLGSLGPVRIVGPEGFRNH